MASAQVLPDSAASSLSRKQGHLEAGKRRLEEFHKKKAEGRAKKAASTSQLQSADVNQNEKLAQKCDNLKLLSSDGGTERDGVSAVQCSEPVTTQDNKVINSSLGTELDSLSVANAACPTLAYDYNAFYKDPEKPARHPESTWHDCLGFSGQECDCYDRWREEKNDELSNSMGTERELTYVVSTDHATAVDTVHSYPNIEGNIHQFSYNSLHEAQSEENRHSSKEYLVKDPGTSNVLLTSNLPGKSVSVPMPSKVESSGTSTAYNASATYDATNLIESAQRVELYKDGDMALYNAKVSEMGGKMLGGVTDYLRKVENAPWQTSESFLSSSNLNFRSSSNRFPLCSPLSFTSIERSRPSFLDSLNVPRVSSTSHLPATESEKSAPFFPLKSSKVDNGTMLYSSALSSHL